ncbi:divalent-cation tolerance protein CutA [Desulfomicrobium escambiense]|uniref:divalent-cation tolerance protein CutA n=1 Tax=Desulfomicrobium escambiense TaxID=29503 RepID=UPI0003F7EB8D|nr:divalent-cation tolerance protein CutA [Desulfomicrobium escambiense]
MSEILVYMTAPDLETARRIGRTLVERRLAACVNILPSIESMYWWDGSVQSEVETAFVVKTKGDLYERLQACVLGMHPYELPCIVALDIDRGHAPFLRWIDEQTGAAGGAHEMS